MYDEIVLDSDDISISRVGFFVGERPDSNGYSDVGLLLLNLFDLFHTVYFLND